MPVEILSDFDDTWQTCVSELGVEGIPIGKHHADTGPLEAVINREHNLERHFDDELYLAYENGYSATGLYKVVENQPLWICKR